MAASAASFAALPRAERGRFSARSRASASRAVSSRASRLARVRPRAAGFEPALVDGAALRAASHDERRAMLLGALRASRGVVLIRGGLADLSPSELVAFSRAVGDDVERNPGVATRFLLPDHPEIQRIGNAVDPATGERVAMFSRAPPLPRDPATGAETIAYDPVAHSPVWHTDQAFREPPPFASLLYCRAHPPPGDGGDTVFADCVAAYDALSDEDKARIDDLDAICSYAHHNAKVKKRTPSYPLLTPEERAKNPPVFQPVARAVREYYVRSSESARSSGADEKDERSSQRRRSVYGFSSAVCAVVPRGERVEGALLDRYELEGEEDASVRALMYETLLPHCTREAFTYRHAWKVGDVVLWDNLRTIHAATPFDEAKDREMWRTTVAAPGEGWGR